MVPILQLTYGITGVVSSSSAGREDENACGAGEMRDFNGLYHERIAYINISLELTIFLQ